MSEEKSQRTYESVTLAHNRANLEPLRPTTQGQAKRLPNSRMTPRQRRALVLRLIDFLKTS